MWGLLGLRGLCVRPATTRAGISSCAAAADTSPSRDDTPHGGGTQNKRSPLPSRRGIAARKNRNQEWKSRKGPIGRPRGIGSYSHAHTRRHTGARTHTGMRAGRSQTRHTQMHTYIPGDLSEMRGDDLQMETQGPMKRRSGGAPSRAALRRCHGIRTWNQTGAKTVLVEALTRGRPAGMAASRP